MVSVTFAAACADGLSNQECCRAGVQVWCAYYMLRFRVLTSLPVNVALLLSY